MIRFGSIAYQNTSKDFVFILVITNMFIVTSSCDIKKTNSSKDMSQSIKIENQMGVVGFWETVNSYTITVHELKTYDSQILFVVENMPDSLKKPGIKVLFSGNYKKNPKLPLPFLGGQEIFQLDIIEIQRNDKK